MAQVVSPQQYTLENSTLLTRPDLKTFLSPDTNSGSTDVTHHKDRVNYGRLHIPTATGPLNYEVICCDSKSGSVGLPHSGKKRIELSIVDPITSFISPAGEVFINSNKYGLSSFGKSRIEPQTTIPQDLNSIRLREEAIDELKRTTPGETEPALRWDSKKISDGVLRARLGGWTSAQDPRTLNQQNNKSTKPYRLQEIFPNMELGYKTEEERDNLAKNYMYTTSTQEMYSQVHWDSKVPRKMHAPTTTFENGIPDQVKRREELDPRPQVWQTVIGAAWDRAQDRDSHLSREAVAYTAPTRRGDQLPGYGGHIGGKNLQSMDDYIEKFEPFTKVRTIQPKEPEPNYKINIPGYTGNTHHFKTNNVSHYDTEGKPYTTTAAYHRELPSFDQTKTETTIIAGDFSRIQTKVPPINPYDNIARPTVPAINNSLDNHAFPIVNSKHPNHADFINNYKQKELRSILKKHQVPNSD